jgi:hypothetical protein
MHLVENVAARRKDRIPCIGLRQVDIIAEPGGADASIASFMISAMFGFKADFARLE